MSLFKWEMRQMLRTKAFWFVGGAILFLMLIFHCEEFLDGGVSGFELFISFCNDFSSLSMFFVGIFAGLHVTGSLEERRMQAAVMAGNSRGKVLLAKYTSFITAITMFFVASAVIPAAFGFVKFGTVCEDGTFLRSVVARALLFLLAEIASSTICFIIAMICKKPGITVIVNLVTLITIDIALQYIAIREWGMEVLKYIPRGQEAIIMSDMSNKNSVLALTVCTAFIALIFVGSYVKFRKAELK